MPDIENQEFNSEGQEAVQAETIDEAVQESDEGKVADVPDKEAEAETKTRDNVPLATLLEEKKRRKTLEKKLREFETKQLDDSLQNKRRALVDKYKSQGYDEDFANSLADDLTGITQEVRTSIKKEKDALLFDKEVDEEISDLSQTDSFYSDASLYKREIKSKISEFRNQGADLSVEDAYNLVRSKTRYREIQEEIEQKKILDRRNAPNKGATPNASPTAPKNPYPLDDDDKKALEGLKRIMPEAQWTTEKYYKMIKGE